MRNARDGRNGVLRGTPSTVATVATVAEEKMALKERGAALFNPLKIGCLGFLTEHTAIEQNFVFKRAWGAALNKMFSTDG